MAPSVSIAKTCYVLHFEDCMCGPAWFYEGCNPIMDNTNIGSVFFSGLVYFKYAFSFGTAATGWDSPNDFPFDEDYLTCWQGHATTYESGDCSGTPFDMGFIQCTLEQKTKAYYDPPGGPTCFGGG